MNQRILLLLFVLSFIPTGLVSAQDAMPRILDMRQRAEVIDNVLEERIKTVLPELMRREGIDMWIVMAREYNEDPVIRTLLPAKWLAARRRRSRAPV